MKDIFIDTKRDEAFASISKDLIDNDDIRYIFPKGRHNLMCYMINRKEILKLVSEDKVCYNWFDEVPFD